jgi:uncharacterized membrane protein
MSDAHAKTQVVAGDLRTIVLIVYSLFLLAMFNGFTAVAGVILAYIKRDEARGTIWESHFRNLIHVFWIALAVAVVAVALLIEAAGGFAITMFATNGNPPPIVIAWLVALIPVFWLGAVLFFLWYLYRTVRGLVQAIESKPY